MDLSAEQQAQVASWIKAGDNLAEVQRKLESEFGLRLTYMDVRFLVDDLSLQLPEKPAPKQPDPKPEDLSADPHAPKSGGPGKVSLQLDKIARPGALVSGSVTFSDGQRATWMLDQMGRLGLDGVGPDYRPPGDDLATFQQELQTALQRAGFA